MTIYDIAKRAGVSHMTVSNVLNRRRTDKSSLLTAERVRRVARDLGYVPNRAARTLRCGRTHSIVLPTQASIRYAHIHDLCEEIERALGPHGYHLDLELLAWRKDLMEAYRSYRAGRCDGMILGSIPAEFGDDLRALRRHGMAVVTMAQNPASLFDNVAYNLAEEAEIGARHLLSQGHRAIAFVVHPDNLKPAPWRTNVQGYEAVLSSAGVQRPEGYAIPWVVGDDPAPLWQSLQALHPRPTAVMVYNPELACALWGTMRLAAARPREEPVLLSCGDADLLQYLRITAVKMDYRQWATAIVERLMAQLAAPSAAPMQVWIKPRLVER